MENPKDMRTLLESMDSVYKEVTEEEYVDPNVIKMLFKSLDYYYDNIETFEDRLSRGALGKRMQEAGYHGEYKSLLNNVRRVMQDLDDLLPGLEMIVRGDD